MRLVAVNAQRKALLAQADDAEAHAAAQRASEAEWTRAADVLRSFSDDASEKLRGDIESLVTHALRSVFSDQSMAFRIHTRQLRGTNAVEFALASGGVEQPVPGAHGGGVLQVVAFVLRVVVLMLDRRRRPILFLDEPFSHVSANYRPALAQFLRELVDTTDLQLFIVTHDDATPEVADMALRLEQHAGAARVVVEDRAG